MREGEGDIDLGVALANAPAPACSADWAKEIAEEEEWDNLTNVFIAVDVKEQIKATWGLKTVPHYTLIGADGKILQVTTQAIPTTPHIQ